MDRKVRPSVKRPSRNSLRTATITEWPPKWFLKLSAADRPLRCMVLFWLFFVLVLVLVLSEAVLVLDRSCD